MNKKMKQGIFGLIICFTASVIMSLLAAKATRRLIESKRERGVMR